MAGASDKARFYLEQSVPELREWERREIFSKGEITAIAAKRSSFEHILSARGSQPTDYARYAEYEMNLDALRRQRVKRKGVKATAHTGQQHIFLILDRATRKFHGDIGLWMQYIEYARKQKANKKVSRILTEVLRMHPTKPELWIYAAKYAIDVQADMQAARSFLQRGLRFCKTSRALYLEYARLEMGYLAKVTARRKILGLEGSRSAPLESEPSTDEAIADIIALPTYTPADLELGQSISNKEDNANIPQTSSLPITDGAIPMAIFDAAMKQFNQDHLLGEQFFDMLANFDQVPSLVKILRHVLTNLLSGSESSVSALSCQCRLHLVGIPTDSPEYPPALGHALKDVKKAMNNAHSDRSLLAEKFIAWLSTLANTAGIAPELRKVMLSTIHQLSKVIQEVNSVG